MSNLPSLGASSINNLKRIGLALTELLQLLSTNSRLPYFAMLQKLSSRILHPKWRNPQLIGVFSKKRRRRRRNNIGEGKLKMAPKAKRERATTSKKRHLQDRYEGANGVTEEEKRGENEKGVILKKKTLLSKGKCKRGTAIKKKNLPNQNEELAEETEGEEEDGKETEVEEEENENTVELKRKPPHSKARRKRIKEDLPDQYGADIFKSGRAVQPKNPYFVATIRAKRRDQLYIPVDVIRDYNLELRPETTMTIHDSNGRKFGTKVRSWKDGRLWLIGGWHSLCRWNLVERNDQCICEFVEGNEGLCLQVQVVHKV